MPTIFTGCVFFWGGGVLMRSCLPVAMAFIVTELCDEAEETFEHQEVLQYV
jgi:hypothetical protein